MKTNAPDPLSTRNVTSDGGSGRDQCQVCGHELHLSKPYAGLLQALRIVERRPRCGFSETVQDALVDMSDDCTCEDGSHAGAVA